MFYRITKMRYASLALVRQALTMRLVGFLTLLVTWSGWRWRRAISERQTGIATIP